MKSAYILKEIAGKMHRLLKDSAASVAVEITLGKVYRILILLYLLSVFPAANAQDSIQVKGIVLSGPNQPLADVLVSIAGSDNLAVVTGSNGEFTIQCANLNDWLIISPANGFKQKRININGRNFISIYLTPNGIASGDDQLSVLGNSIPRKNMIAAYSLVKMDDQDQLNVLSADQYMQGKVPGMFTTGMSGQPGSGAVTFIRGLSSVNANTQPLYIVDGVPTVPHNVFQSNIEGFFYNPLLGINPYDISQVVIVKDPVINAAYGSKGSNGIVFINTLDPSATQTVIELEMKTGYRIKPDRLIPQMNSTQHKTLISEMLISAGLLEEDISEMYPILNLEMGDPRYINYQHNTNWQKHIFDNASFSNVNLTVKGGDEIARYGLSFGYLSDNGIIKNTSYQGYNLRFVGTLNIFRWLKMNTAVSIINNKANLKESAKVNETSPILSSLAKSPLLNPFQYDVNGKEIIKLTEVDELSVSNPVAIIQNFMGQNTNNEFTSSLGLEAAINKNFTLNSKFGLAFNMLKENIFMPNKGMQHYSNMEAINVAKASNNSINSFFNNTNLLFSKEINDNHQFSLSTGMNLWSNTFEYDWGSTQNSSENDQYRRLQDGTNNLRSIGGANRRWNWVSFYENVNYNLNNRYFLSATISIDGSSRIGDSAVNTVDLGGLPFGVFYSGGAAWVISRESFLKDIDWLDQFKLRTSYGISGNDDIGESNANNYYEIVRFRETAGLYPAIMHNPELSYEIVNQFNAGADLSFLGYRFTFNIDLYNEKIDNLLIYKSIKSYYGYSYRPENDGSMENKGFELSTFLRIVNSPSFTWDVEANFTKLKNSITGMSEVKMVVPIQGGQVIYQIGQPAGSFYGYRFKGVFASSQEAAEANLYNNKGILFGAGDAVFEDIDGIDGHPDGIIDEYDKTIIGSPIPEFYGGFTSTFRYKRWSLSGFIQFVSGNEIFNYVRYKNEQLTGIENQDIRVLNRWQYEGHITDIPRATWKDPIGNSAFSDRWIEDGSYIRLKNITLSYAIPGEFFVFRNARFFASANNLWSFNQYLGYDPEVSYSYSPVGQGVDYGLSPQSKSFILGINLGL